jgi:penicillin amidase
MRRALRLLRRLLVVLGVLVLLIGAGIAGVIWLSLPGGDLTAAIPGLSAPVAITLDADGVPRIRAANASDAAVALGFLHARERMFQMELMRRAVSGELSELFGPATLPVDRMMRTLGLRRRVVADLPALPANVRAILDAYARGVNAWIALRGRFAAPEFVAFGAPRPWSTIDSLLWGKSMSIYLAGNWRVERARLVLDAILPPAVVDSLWPPAGGGGPQARLVDPALARVAARLAEVVPTFPAPFTLPDTASNAWAVDGRHTATGAPLLAGDPHLGFGFPSLWYLVRIDTPGHVLAGATAPGVPALILGHNEHIAWSFTNTGADVQDLFVETPVGKEQYATPDGPRPFVLHEEHIRVRGAPDEVLMVRETRHGPVISDLVDPKGPILALAAAELAPGDIGAAGILALDAAADVEAAGRAAPLITSPVQNLMVADRTSIALFVTGRVPIRAGGDGARPVPGADGRYDWTGWASGRQLPYYIAPASGRLVNANERVAPPDFPIFLGRDWFDEWRAQRIRDLLGKSDRHTVADFAAMQTDVADLAAQAMLPRLTALAVTDPAAKAAQALLNGWNGAASRDAPQPLIFNAWMIAADKALRARLGVPPEGAAALAPWPQLLPYALSPAGAALCRGDCDALLVEALSAAVADLARRFGPDPTAWRWERAHEAVFAHPLLSHLPLFAPLGEGRIGVGGDDSTIDRAGVAADTLASIHGPEFRGVYDLADLDASLFVTAPGQSGNPFSRLAYNFLERWRDGASIMLGPEPAKVAVRIALQPAEANP